MGQRTSSEIHTRMVLRTEYALKCSLLSTCNLQNPRVKYREFLRNFGKFSYYEHEYLLNITE